MIRLPVLKIVDLGVDDGSIPIMRVKSLGYIRAEK